MKSVVMFAALIIASPASAQDTTESIGNWTVKKTVDSFSDSKRGISNTAIETTTGTIVIKCDKPGADSLYVSILTSEYLGSKRAGSAEYRLDASAPSRLPMSTYDGRGAHLFSGSAQAFLAALATANPKRLRIQFLGYDKLVNVDIDVTGVADVIKKTAAICEDKRFG